MKLPDRLDYEEEQSGGLQGEWFPVVTCAVKGCRWSLDVTWDALGDDGDIDWNAEHPPHG